MKKALIIITTLFLSNLANAQLKVGTNGNIYLGSDTTVLPISRLSLGSAGSSAYEMSIKSNNNGLEIQAGSGKTALTISGSFSSNQNTNLFSITPINGYGGYNKDVSAAFLFTPPSNNGYSYGIKAHNFTSGPSNPYRVAVIYGSSSMGTNTTYNGVYAGFFDGDVRVTGTLYGTLLTPSSSSSTISSLTNGGNSEESRTELVEQSVSERLSNVQLLQIMTPHRLETVSNLINKNDIQRNPDGTLNEEELNRLIEEHKNDPPIQTQMSEKRYGLATDQLKEVFPELVYEDEDGNVSINYIEMVPLLVQSINELQERIDVLEQTNANLMAELKDDNSAVKLRDGVTDIGSLDADILTLSQNDPNPFSERTTISLTVPQEVTTAAVFFYDMSGKQIDKRIITERGNTQISVTSADFTEGMYLYSLIADGKVVATKKMILTK